MTTQFHRMCADMSNLTEHFLAAMGTAKEDEDGSLKLLRECIDGIDNEIVTLLHMRTRLAIKIGEHKRANGIPLYSPQREADVLHKVCAGSSEELSRETIEKIFRVIMRETLNKEIEDIS